MNSVINSKITPHTDKLAKFVHNFIIKFVSDDVSLTSFLGSLTGLAKLIF